MNLTSERAALDVMKRHIDALNALDENSLAETLHFPHYRLVGSKLHVWTEKRTTLPIFTKGLAINGLYRNGTQSMCRNLVQTKFIYWSKLFVSTITKMSLQGSSHYG